MKKRYAYSIKIHPAEADETGFWVEVPALPGCVTQGETYDEALANAEEAIEGFLEALAKAGQPIPHQPSPRGEFSGHLVVKAPVMA